MYFMKKTLKSLKQLGLAALVTGSTVAPSEGAGIDDVRVSINGRTYALVEATTVYPDDTYRPAEKSILVKPQEKSYDTNSHLKHTITIPEYEPLIPLLGKKIKGTLYGLNEITHGVLYGVNEIGHRTLSAVGEVGKGTYQGIRKAGKGTKKSFSKARNHVKKGLEKRFGPAHRNGPVHGQPRPNRPWKHH
jgi:hypothetical protein